MGKQGTGKGIMLHHILKPLFGNTQAVQIEDEQLRDKFNRWLENKMLIAFNEVAYDNNTCNSVNSKIKAIITDPELQINEKNIKAYFVRNFANCVFYSNEGIPVLIEDGDRRFNVVRTGDKLINKSWFKDREEFFNKIKTELPAFAQYLMNYNYDPTMATTVITNPEKESLINAGKNRFQEFADKLRAEDVDWLNESQISKDSVLDPKTIITKSDVKGRILKDTALDIFNKIHPYSRIEKTTLTKQLAVYGIQYKREDDENKVRRQYYKWKA